MNKYMFRASLTHEYEVEVEAKTVESAKELLENNVQATTYGLGEDEHVIVEILDDEDNEEGEKVVYVMPSVSEELNWVQIDPKTKIELETS